MIVYLLAFTAVVCSAFALFMVARFWFKESLDQPSSKQKERRLQPRTAEQAFTPKQQCNRLKLEIESVSDFKVTSMKSAVCGYHTGYDIRFTYLWQGYVLKSGTVKADSVRLAIKKMQWIADNTKINWWY